MGSNSTMGELTSPVRTQTQVPSQPYRRFLRLARKHALSPSTARFECPHVPHNAPQAHGESPSVQHNAPHAYAESPNLPRNAPRAPVLPCSPLSQRDYTVLTALSASPLGAGCLSGEIKLSPPRTHSFPRLGDLRPQGGYPSGFGTPD